ncbi:MAG: hypothetical protein M1820_010840 [Bogoriella megaspora]|nr:MAG: hypothetical protein M1820_010840 [Bogoriella megaspora]
MALVGVLEALPPADRWSRYTPSLLALREKRQNLYAKYSCGMDPLSVAASIISIAGAAAGTVKVLYKLHDAPSDVCGLLEELQDLQAVLAGLHTVVKKLPEDDTSPSTRLLTQSLTDLLDRGKVKIAQIGGIVHGLLDRPASQNGKAKVSRVSWLMEKGKVRGLQEDIRSIKLSLALLLGAVTSNNLAKVEAQVVEFSCMTRDFINTRTRTSDLETEELINNPESPDYEELPEYQDATKEHDHQEKAILDKNIAGNVKAVVPGRPPPSKQVTRRSSPRLGCPKLCKCTCHKRNRLSTPGLLEPVIGSCSIGFEGLPWQGWKCLPECKRKAAASADVNYHFPRWLMMRKLQASFQAAVGGPELLLRVSRQLPSQDKLVSLVYTAQFEAVRTLFAEKQASPFDVSGPHCSPLLIHGVFSQNVDMCKLLLDYGADIYAENNVGTRGIDEAWNFILTLPEGKKRTDFEEMFKSDDYFEEKGFNIIHRVATGVSTNIGLEDALIASGEDIDAQDNDGRTALSWAAGRGDFKSAQVLLAYEADPNIPDRYQSPPLFYACRFGSLECVNLLLSYGADPTFVAEWGDGALHNAGKFDTATGELALRLILAGAPINLRDRCGWTPICYATCFAQDAKVVETLMAHGADMKNVEESGMTPLMQATRFNSYDCLSLMLQKDPEWDRNITDHRGGSLLHMAADHADAKTINILANERLAGVELHRRDSQDRTAHDVFNERMDLGDELVEAWNGLISTVAEQEQTENRSDELEFSGLEKGIAATNLSEGAHHHHIHNHAATSAVEAF